jgi:hypothetical protein
MALAPLLFHNARRSDKPGRIFSTRIVKEPIMADTIRGKLTEAGNAISETAQKVGNRIGEKAEQAKDWTKEKVNKARNRADEASEKAENEAEVVQQDEKAKEGNCG